MSDFNWVNAAFIGCSARALFVYLHAQVKEDVETITSLDRNTLYEITSEPTDKKSYQTTPLVVRRAMGATVTFEMAVGNNLRVQSKLSPGSPDLVHSAKAFLSDDRTVNYEVCRVENDVQIEREVLTEIWQVSRFFLEPLFYGSFRQAR